MEREINYIEHAFVDTMPNDDLFYLLWDMLMHHSEVKNYNECFQEAYNRNLYNKAAIFNHHLWVDYYMKKSQYHPSFKLWVEWPDKEGNCNDSESSN